ncbi:MAG: 4Fe-4S binding protein, partial [Acidimicrobiia bacterium]|nr:4Fe-4S binding protein [Acidimicrobiia bacterium]
DLLHRQVHQYVAAPAIDPAVCVAGSGCRACVDVCPRQALTWHAGEVSYDRVACEPCGRCVTACPTGAVVNPAITPAQLEAEITAALDPAVGPPGPRGIVFTCSRAGAPLPTDGAPPGTWYPVSLPCVGMASAAWLLAPLLMGAGSVVARPCSDTGCPLDHSDVVESTVAFCADLLSALGSAPERVSTDADRVLEPLPKADLHDRFDPGATLDILRSLVALDGSQPALVIDHERSPLGIIDIDIDTCTACTMCAQVCPTDALQSAQSADTVVISFDAAQCVACDQCTTHCPELGRGAIALHHRVDMAAVDIGPQDLVRADVVMCEACGAPIGPGPTLERISALLPPQDAAMVDLLQRRCVDCRSRLPVI